MNNTLLVARREFVERARSRGFLFTALGTPLLLVAIWLGSGMLDLDSGAPEESEPEPVAQVQKVTLEGVVDEAGVLGTASLPAQLVAFPSEQEAASALRQGEIDGYYAIPADYRETGTVRRVALQLPTTEPQTGLFESILSFALVNDWPDDVALRLVAPVSPGGPEVVLGDSQGAERTDPGMMPFVLASAIMVPLFTGGGLLLRSLAQEKESRIMEVLLVSVRPRQLLTGKLLGMGALIAVQYLAWLLVVQGVGRVTGQQVTTLLQGMPLEGPQLAIVGLYALGGFVLYAAIMAGLGAITPDMHSSQSWVFIVTLPMMVPFYLWMALVDAPQGALAVGLSLFPYSAPLAMIMRVMVMRVPVWQLALSLALMALACVLTVRLMARLFRAQVLLSGEPLSTARLLAALRQQ
ncbi:MAG: ABC transporter permease [Anaerolineae bacterium]